MKIKNKIRIYFTTSVIVLTALSFILIYILFAEYREEEFQQRQKDKIQYTLGLLTEYKQLSEDLSAIIDELTIHDFYDEKMLIYDQKKQLIYRSLDDLPILKAEKILYDLSPAVQWIETKEGDYDVIGVYIERDQRQYYALSKAYDAFGYTKLKFLQNILIILFIAITGIVLLISQYLARQISHPITNLAKAIKSFNIQDRNQDPIKTDSKTYEIQHLSHKFNELLLRTNDAFAFQKHAVQHISHELKTPIAILVSELERAKKIEDTAIKDEIIESQIIKAKSLADIITILMEISKDKSSSEIAYAPIRLDEIIFTGIEDLALIHPDFNFALSFVPDDFPENHLIIKGNPTLIRQAFLNIMMNSIMYSLNAHAEIIFNARHPDAIKISFINRGVPIETEEVNHLYDHFFKGSNAPQSSGFGLGLVLTKEIVEMHHGSITYSNPEEEKIKFDLRFPLTQNPQVSRWNT